MLKFILIYQLIEYCIFTYLFLTNDKYVKSLDKLFDCGFIQDNNVVGLYSLISLFNILTVLIKILFSCIAYSVDHIVGIIIFIFLSSIKIFVHIVLINKNHIFEKKRRG